MWIDPPPYPWKKPQDTQPYEKYPYPWRDIDPPYVFPKEKKVEIKMSETLFKAYKQNGQFFIVVNVPGCNKKDISLHTTNSGISVSFENKFSKTKHNPHISVSWNEYDDSYIRATVENGILTIAIGQLPNKSRKIEIE